MQQEKIKNSSQENGTIMLLMVLFIIVVVGAVAFGVDLAVIGVSHQELTRAAENAAMGALEAYHSKDGPEALKKRAALTRANEILSQNSVFDQSLHGTTLSYVTANSSGTTLEAGRWYFDFETVPGQQPVNPCPAGKTPPCFAPQGVRDPVNAFRVALPNIYKTKFAGAAFKRDSVNMQAVTIAASVPRNICFLVDISASMVRVTHPYLPTTQQSNTTTQGAQYSFFLAADNGTTRIPEQDDQWDWLIANGGSRTVFGDPTNLNYSSIHFSDAAGNEDYQSRITLFDGDYNAAYSKYHPDPIQLPRYSVPNQDQYRIDTFRDSAHGYDGPEPLTTVMRGLYDAVDFVESRAIPGDRMCLIFYDHRLLWPRVVNLTDDFDYIKSLVDVDSLNDPTNGLEKSFLHSLFPSAQSWTNTVDALREAIRQFADHRTPGVPNSDMIVLIGDGMMNCPGCNLSPADLDANGIVDTSDQLLLNNCMGQSPQNQCNVADIDQDGDIDVDDQTMLINDLGYQCRLGCSNNYDYYQASVNQVKRFARNVLYPRGISLSMILAGDHVAPHTIDIADPNDSTRCLTDREARAQQTSFILGGDANGNSYQTLADWNQAWSATSAANPFYQVNEDLYTAVQMTGGMWGPLRPRDASCGTGNPPAQCNPSLLRRTTDPRCETHAEQMERYMEEIAGSHAYSLVEEN